MTNIYYGFDICDVVKFERFWCFVCTKARNHEIYENQVVCLACCHVSTTEDSNVHTSGD